MVCEIDLVVGRLGRIPVLVLSPGKNGCLVNCTSEIRLGSRLYGVLNDNMNGQKTGRNFQANDGMDLMASLHDRFVRLMSFAYLTCLPHTFVYHQLSYDRNQGPSIVIS